MTATHEREWTGRQCSTNPDTCWIDDSTGEHVNAITGQRTAQHPITSPAERADDRLDATHRSTGEQE